MRISFSLACSLISLTTDMATVRRAMSWSTIYQGFVILLFVLLLDDRRANGQILRFGSCPSFSPLKDFEMEKVYLFFI